MNDPRIIRRGDIFRTIASDARGAPTDAGALAIDTSLVLIVQNDIGNEFGSTVIAAAISFQPGRRSYPINVVIPDGLLGDVAEARLHQLLTLEKERLSKRMARLPRETMAKVDEALRISLGLQS